MRTVVWVSGGVSSSIAAYLLRYVEGLEAYYIDIDDQHPDTMRFIKDTERVIGIPITIMKSRYSSVNNVIKQFRFINSPYGAKCTDILKKRVRKEWESMQKEPITYVWGFDCDETDRANRLVEVQQEFLHRFPLIESGISKQEAHGILDKLGIKRPYMYELDPERGRGVKEIMPECGIACELSL